MEADLDSLEQELQGLWREDVTPQDVRDVIRRHYKIDHGSPDGAVDDEDVRDWLIATERAWLLVGKPPVLRHLPFFPDVGAKASWFVNAPCHTCPMTESGGTFPIEVPPWSHQAQGSEIVRALQSALRDHATGERSPYPRSDALCIRMVFVLEGRARLKDTDNLAKGLLDGLEGYLFENDDQVDHLDLVRVAPTHMGKGYVLVRHARSQINSPNDVLSQRTGVIMANTKESLRLADYLSREEPS